MKSNVCISKWVWLSRNYTWELTPMSIAHPLPPIIIICQINDVILHTYNTSWSEETGVTGWSNKSFTYKQSEFPWYKHANQWIGGISLNMLWWHGIDIRRNKLPMCDNINICEHDTNLILGGMYLQWLSHLCRGFTRYISSSVYFCPSSFSTTIQNNLCREHKA